MGIERTGDGRREIVVIVEPAVTALRLREIPPFVCAPRALCCVVVEGWVLRSRHHGVGVEVDLLCNLLHLGALLDRWRLPGRVSDCVSDAS